MSIYVCRWICRLVYIHVCECIGARDYACTCIKTSVYMHLYVNACVHAYVCRCFMFIVYTIYISLPVCSCEIIKQSKAFSLSYH